MRKAYEKKILIPAFNVAYLPMMKPVVRALVDLETFGLVEVARVEVEKFEAGSFAAVAQEYKTFAQRLENRSHTRLHMDHIPVIDEDGTRVDWERLIQEGLDLKYDSVMIDGSRLSLEENIETTRQVVKMAHARGIPVEAELGAVLGHEKELTMTYEEIYEKKVGFTNPDEARAFVDETGVDWLSVAVGNIHGAISGVAKDKDKVKARLDIAHLSQISEATNVPLVLHGGSGIGPEYILSAIENGITKINIGTDIRQAYEKALKSKPNDLAHAQEQVYEKIKDLVTNFYRIKGSIHKL